EVLKVPFHGLVLLCFRVTAFLRPMPILRIKILQQILAQRVTAAIFIYKRRERICLLQPLSVRLCDSDWQLELSTTQQPSQTINAAVEHPSHFGFPDGREQGRIRITPESPVKREHHKAPRHAV